MAEEKRMPIMDHFGEMRRRFFYAIFSVVGGTLLSFTFSNQIIKFLEAPAGPDFKPVALELLENFSVYFRVSLMAGLIIAMPLVVYQLLAFLAPALTGKERRFILSWIPFIVVMFIAGVAFAYYVALPPALNFLIHFNDTVSTPMIRISNYIDIVTRLLLVIGVVFETPIILMVLARLGVVNSQWLAKQRRYFFVVAFLISAIITPTFDPINQTIIALPLIVLYEVSIWLTRLVQKKKNPGAGT